jgi:hypothetical protein
MAGKMFSSVNALGLLVDLSDSQRGDSVERAAAFAAIAVAASGRQQREVGALRVDDRVSVAARGCGGVASDRARAECGGVGAGSTVHVGAVACDLGGRGAGRNFSVVQLAASGRDEWTNPGLHAKTDGAGATCFNDRIWAVRCFGNNCGRVRRVSVSRLCDGGIRPGGIGDLDRGDGHVGVVWFGTYLSRTKRYFRDHIDGFRVWNGADLAAGFGSRGGMARHSGPGGGSCRTEVSFAEAKRTLRYLLSMSYMDSY